MSRLLELPVEVLLIVYGSLETIKDAGRLSQCCRKLYRIFNDPNTQQRILISIVIDVCPTLGRYE
jgi:multisubunit Na+/H+ antiporter MnhC subunit